MKIGIIGLGNFGLFIAKTFTKYSKVIGYSRTDYSTIANKYNIDFYTQLEDFLAQDIDIIVISVSIISFEKVLQQLSHYSNLLENKLVVDVLSVKEYPSNLVQQILPLEKYNIDYLATHPMFGPDSGKNGWDDLPLVYDIIRDHNSNRIQDFLSIFKNEKCKLVSLSCKQHDIYTSQTQFITHLTGRILNNLELPNTSINTTGYNSLLTLVDNTCHDSTDLFIGLYKYNSQSKEILTQFRKSLDNIESQLQETTKSQ